MCSNRFTMIHLRPADDGIYFSVHLEELCSSSLNDTTFFHVLVVRVTSVVGPCVLHSYCANPTDSDWIM